MTIHQTHSGHRQPGDSPTASASPLTLTAAQVAGLLGCQESTFREKRRRLEHDHGFPARLPGCNAWSAPAVRRWIATNGLTFMPPDIARDERHEATATIAASELLAAYGRADA
uniref:helix-turn-helix transcriptional regulator n=1 Tax=Stappia sp. TaxID=1870903 RepID=UPI003BAC51B3